MIKYFLEDEIGLWVRSLDFPGPGFMTTDPLKAWDFPAGRDGLCELLKEFKGSLTKQQWEMIEDFAMPALNFPRWLRSEGIDIKLKVRKQEFFPMSNGDYGMVVNGSMWVTCSEYNRMRSALEKIKGLI